MRARFDGNSVASRHAPQHAEKHEPDDEHGEPETHPEQPQHAADRQHAPTRSGWRRWRRGRRVPRRREVAPPVARAVRQREELADGRAPACRSSCGWRRGCRRRRRPRRSSCRASSPASGGPWRRCRCTSRCRGPAGTHVRRALPRFCRLEDLGVVDPAELGDRAAPGEQRRRARQQPDERPQRRPRLAEAAGEQPDDQLDDGEHGELERAQRQPAAAVSVATRAHPVAGPQQVVVEVGPADRRAPRGGGPGPAGRRRRGRRSGGPASTGRRRRRGT